MSSEGIQQRNILDTDAYSTNSSKNDIQIDEPRGFERGAFDNRNLGADHGTVVYAPQVPEETYYEDDELRVIPLVKPQHEIIPPDKIEESKPQDFDEDSLLVIPLRKSQTDTITGSQTARTSHTLESVIDETFERSNVLESSMTKGGPYKFSDLAERNSLQTAKERNKEEDRLRVIPLTKITSKY